MGPTALQRHVWAQYAFAAFVAIAALLLRLALGFAPGEPPIVIIFVVPIIASAYVGLGPGLLSLAMSVFFVWRVLMPLSGSSTSSQIQLVQLSGLVVSGLLTNVLAETVRQSRRRLAASEHLHAITLASIGDGVITVDVVGRVMFANAEAEQLTGWPRHEAAGRPVTSILRLLSAGTREPAPDPAAAAIAAGAALPRANHTILVARDGREVPIETSVAPIRDESGRVDGVVIVFRDVSARVQAETVLHERVVLQEQLERIAATAPGVLHEFRLRPDGSACYPYAGPGMQNIFGVPPEELKHDAAPVFARVNPEDLDGVLASSRESARTMSEWHQEFRVRHPERGEIWVEGRSMPERESDGGVLWHGFLTDITTRKRAEEGLRASEERFRQIAESIREVFWLRDPRTQQVIYVSPAYETLWGRSRDAIYASPRDWLEAVHADDRARVAEAAMTQAEGHYDVEYRIVRPDGVMRWIRDRAFPVRDPQGRVIRVAGVAEDMTDRRALEAQLRQAQKMESIGQLAGGVAHDFNNWLTVILGSAELMADSLPAGDSSRQLIEEIRRATERAAALTRQLLAFSRNEVIDPRVLDLNALVTDTEKMLRPLLGEDVLLRARLDPAIARVKVDAGHWVQVLMNLAVNARDAMPRGGQLTIETADEAIASGPASADRRGTPPGHYVRLTVTDTGSGMTPDVMARVFEPFFTTKAAGRGTGLGLAVVYGIVQQSGGYIDVRSELNVGTTFTMHIPAVAGASSASVPPASAQPRVDGAETILLVEDEASLRQIAVRGLSKRGYTVLEAADGRQAVELMHRHPHEIDLLVTDVVMPGMNGRELADALRREAPNLPVLYTSGYTVDAIVRHGVEQANVAFLQKPYTPNTLLTKIRSILDAA